MSKKTCLLILEYGIPHYRTFLFDFFNKCFNQFHIIHSGERFQESLRYKSIKGKNLKVNEDLSIVFFNPIRILNANVIISTFNIYKPHTWFWVLIFPWKNWILWGQGLGKSNFRPLKLFRKLIIKISNGYVVYSERGKLNLIENGIDPNKISVAYNTLNIENHELTFGEEYFLYVGRIQERKGLEKAIKACKELGFKFLIVGDGILKGELMKYAENSNHIIFQEGVFEEEALKLIFSKAIAYLSPDHVGLGVVHAFAYGVPVITNKSKEHAPEFDYCNDQNSYLYSDDKELKDILKEAVLNRNKRNEKGNSAYEFYKEKLSSESMIKSFEYHFKKLNK